MTVQAYFGISILLFLVYSLENTKQSYARFAERMNIQKLSTAIVLLNIGAAIVSILWLPLAVGYILVRTWKLVKGK